jgi:hypothetical protein
MPKHSGKYYIDKAEQADNIRVEKGKGDHYKFYGTTATGEKDFMVCPYNLKSDGVENKVRKFLIKMGVVLGILLMLYLVYTGVIVI